MALMPVYFSSKTLNVSTSVSVILPGPQVYAEPPKVLYLLHGYGDDQTTWMRQTSIERYASQYNLAVVMPFAYHSFYTDEKHGENYWTYISQELPEVIHRYFHLSKDPADTLVAGNSMGGYGAMKLALTYPERFAAAGCFSGAVDIRDCYDRNVASLEGSAMRIFGGKDIPDSSDLYLLMQRSAPVRPRIYAACGDKDFLYNEHQTFVPALKKAGWDVTHREDPGMTHSWTYWDGVVRDFLAWAIE